MGSWVKCFAVAVGFILGGLFLGAVISVSLFWIIGKISPIIVLITVLSTFVIALAVCFHTGKEPEDV